MLMDGMAGVSVVDGTAQISANFRWYRKRRKCLVLVGHFGDVEDVRIVGDVGDVGDGRRYLLCVAPCVVYYWGG